MKKYLLAATVAAVAVASPAVARDGTGYVGIEGGLLFPSNTDFDVETDDGVTTVDYDDGFEVDYKSGYDIDLVGGYDFGMFRGELELGYKRAKIDSVDFSTALADDLEDVFGEPITDEDIDIDDRVRVLSLMGNALLDFGGDEGFGAYVGLGFGRAGVKLFDDSDSAWAWQLIAGARTAISENIDLGLKYRYFQTGRLNFDEDFSDGVDTYRVSTDGKFRSHSLLASLIFNFGAPAAPLPPPPPPPPPAPVVATQTCPDGSVILATDACPLPPPPPPPPPAPGERG